MSSSAIITELLRPTLPLLQGQLRAWRYTDAGDLVAGANDPLVAQNLRDVFPHPYTPADADWYLRFVRDTKSTDIHLAIEVDGTAAGAISVIFQADINRRGAEIGYWLGRAYWGRGIVTEAVRVLSAYAFAHFDLCRLYACIMATNPASGRVLEKAGYALEGRMRRSITKAGQTVDGLLYALTVND